MPIDFNPINTAATGFVSRCHTYVKGIETAHVGYFYSRALDGLNYYLVDSIAKPVLQKAPEWVYDNRAVNAVLNNKNILIVTVAVVSFVLFVVWLHPEREASREEKVGKSGGATGDSDKVSGEETGEEEEVEEEEGGDYETAKFYHAIFYEPSENNGSPTTTAKPPEVETLILDEYSDDNADVESERVGVNNTPEKKEQEGHTSEESSVKKRFFKRQNTSAASTSVSTTSTHSDTDGKTQNLDDILSETDDEFKKNNRPNTTTTVADGTGVEKGKESPASSTATTTNTPASSSTTTNPTANATPSTPPTPNGANGNTQISNNKTS